MRLRLPTVAIVAAALFSAPLAASAQSAAMTERTIIVSGVGEASAEPDMVMITIGVETRGATAGEAIQKNNAQMKNTLQTLKKLGVRDKDLQTSNLSVNAQYDYQSNRSNPRVTGYNANNTLRVKLRDLDDAGQILDQTISAGANRMNGMSFGFSDPKPLLDQARVDAVAAAKSKAELYADAAGVNLGKLLQINDGAAPVTPGPRPMMRMDTAAEASAVQIERGESTLRANVTLIYAIE